MSGLPCPPLTCCPLPRWTASTDTGVAPVRRPSASRVHWSFTTAGQVSRHRPTSMETVGCQKGGKMEFTDHLTANASLHSFCFQAVISYSAEQMEASRV